MFWKFLKRLFVLIRGKAEKPLSPSVVVYSPTWYSFFSIIVRVSGLLLFFSLFFYFILNKFFDECDFVYIYFSYLEGVLFYMWETMLQFEFFFEFLKSVLLECVLTFSFFFVFTHFVIGTKHMFNLGVINVFEDFFFRKVKRNWGFFRKFVKIDRFFILVCFIAVFVGINGLMLIG